MPLLVVAVDSRVKKIQERLNGMRCKNDLLREAFAEFLGTLLLTLLGDAVIAVLTLNNAGNVSGIVGPIGWGLALMLSICVTGGVSGCHANPAVTLALATVGKTPWRKVPVYFLSQYVGAFFGSVLLYAIYYEAIHHFDGGNHEIPPHPSATAQIFATYSEPHVGILTTLGDQVVGTAILLMAIVSVTDPYNMTVPKGSFPFVLGLCLAAIIFAFPYNCGAPLNPARDLSPRIFTAIAGWGKAVFSFRDYSYFWVPIVGPHIGAVIGVWAYKLLIEQHWPVDSYDFASPSEIKTNGEFKKKDDLPFVDRKRTTTVEVRKVNE